MRNYIWAAGLWQEELNENIEKLIQECGCVQAESPSPHPVASRKPTLSEKQNDLGIDAIFLEGTPCLNVVCRCIGWSETAMLKSKQLVHEANVFKKIQIQRYGIQIGIHCDNENNKGRFKTLCDKLGIKLVLVFAGGHEANGSIESANRILGHFFRGIRAERKEIEPVGTSRHYRSLTAHWRTLYGCRSIPTRILSRRKTQMGNRWDGYHRSLPWSKGFERDAFCSPPSSTAKKRTIISASKWWPKSTIKCTAENQKQSITLKTTYKKNFQLASSNRRHFSYSDAK